MIGTKRKAWVWQADDRNQEKGMDLVVIVVMVVVVVVVMAVNTVVDHLDEPFF